MDKLKIAFFDTKKYDRNFFEKANQQYNFDIDYFEEHLNNRTVNLAAGHEVICIFVNDIVTAKMLDRLVEEGVKLIALRSAGFNNVDLNAALGRIKIVRVPGYSPYAVAEHAAALMLTLNRKTHKAYFRNRDGNFSINGLLGYDLHGKTAGIIGTGKIGRCFVSIARGFGMEVLAFDSRPDEKYAAESNIKYVPLNELYSRSDIISLHCPLTPETTHLINADSIAKMKEGVMIINTGRGKLIKTVDLIEGLKQKKIGAAGLDVYEEENEYFFEDFSSTMIDDDTLARLMTFPNVLITSHQGFFTQEAMSNIAATTLQNIDDFIKGKELKYEVCAHCGG
jgi:D-lactate dehydrogenase